MSVRFVTLAIIVTLASLPIGYVVGRLAALALRPSRGRRASGRADLLFARGVAPTTTAIIVAFAIVLPSFLIFEPRHDGEQVGPMLVILAALGAMHLLLVAFRVLRIMSVSRQWAVKWMRGATALSRGEWGLPAFRIDAGLPVVAVSGILRPRLFVDRSVIESCSPEELAAIAAHERAHVDVFDNLRRLWIGAFEGPRSAAARAWRQAAEEAADERAVDTSARALDLASALVKIARLAPHRLLDCTALSTIHDGRALEARVHHLLTLDTVEPPRRSRRFTKVAIVAALVVFALYWTPMLGAVYALVETAVKDLH